MTIIIDEHVWTVLRNHHGYVAWCDGLKLTAEAEKYDDLLIVIRDTLDDFLRNKG